MKNGLIIDNYGYKYWYKDNLLHREDGPAVEHVSGFKMWYLEGKSHREDGPAVECIDGSKAWYYQGQIVECSSQQEFEKLIKLKVFW